jgi:hypothetical protein
VTVVAVPPHAGVPAIPPPPVRAYHGESVAAEPIPPRRAARRRRAKSSPPASSGATAMSAGTTQPGWGGSDAPAGPAAWPRRPGSSSIQFGSSRDAPNGSNGPRSTGIESMLALAYGRQQGRGASEVPRGAVWPPVATPGPAGPGGRIRATAERDIYDDGWRDSADIRGDIASRPAAGRRIREVSLDNSLSGRSPAQRCRSSQSSVGQDNAPRCRHAELSQACLSVLVPGTGRDADQGHLRGSRAGRRLAPSAVMSGNLLFGRPGSG